MPRRALISFSRVLIALSFVVELQLANRNLPPEIEGTLSTLNCLLNSR